MWENASCEREAIGRRGDREEVTIEIEERCLLPEAEPKK
jgi:hypothetical protein